MTDHLHNATHSVDRFAVKVFTLSILIFKTAVSNTALILRHTT